MAVTTTSIRALLNRPRGLLDETINEYISIRTLEVNKVSRSNIYGEGDYAVTTELKEAAIKALVSVDCLLMLIDTIPTYHTERDGRFAEQRFRDQLRVLEKRANDLFDQVREKRGAAFAKDSTNTRLS
mgnify:CR=1 FL=1